MPFPTFLKNPLCRLLLGWRIGAGARIGLSYIGADFVDIGASTIVGHLNVVRNCKEFVVGDRVTLMNGNKFFGSNFESQGWVNSIRIDSLAYITSGHFLDISGGLVIENDVVVGGRGSQFWSHSIRIINGRRELLPCNVSVGSGSYLGSNVILICARIPPKSLVGAGSVVNKSFDESATGAFQLIAGNPSSVKRQY